MDLKYYEKIPAVREVNLYFEKKKICRYRYLNFVKY